ncbi:MAG: translation elongation factor 4 [Candidatus Doudnabacteria bacterium]|nr:translation elongation factor 4 [Candidatus Doudnabacteria bacterium]
MEHIRNFCIIAHIDHGKSTLADRLLELTGTVEKREMQAQLLDQMDLEREKGITIKMQPVTMSYTQNEKEYQLNLIDTPGHVDFGYEVSRSLAACEGALLVVDATQGVQAQTLANLYLAIEAGLEIVPVLNKIDLPSADVPRISKEITDLIGSDPSEILAISAKTGEGVPEVLEAIVDRVPAPVAPTTIETQALVFDSVYDDYQGVVANIRLFSGELKRGAEARFLATRKEIDVLEVGVFRPKREKRDVLKAGEVGYVVTGLKDVRDSRVGDTLASSADVERLPGYKPVLPMVFASLYPTDADEYFDLRDALGKLQLNDAALSFEPESSPALGRGFRCGFLGMLHLEIITERLDREFDLELILTTPSVSYLVGLTGGEELRIYNAEQLPDRSQVNWIREPWMKAEVVLPSQYVGQVMELMNQYRGSYVNTEYLHETRAIVHFEIPLASLITDFFDRLKSVTQGYGSLNYEFKEERDGDLVKLDILVAGERVSAFSRLVPRDEAHAEGRRVVTKLKDVIPKQSFAVPLQAAIGGKVIARETIKALRKDVTAKLYGGDVTRKRKLLEKQKKGKKRMAQAGKVQIPQEAFLAVLKREE